MKVILISNCVLYFETPCTLKKTIFPFPFTLNGIWSWWEFSLRFFNQMEFHLDLKSEGKLSARSYPIQCETKWKYSFFSELIHLIYVFPPTVWEEHERIERKKIWIVFIVWWIRIVLYSDTNQNIKYSLYIASYFWNINFKLIFFYFLHSICIILR